MIDYRPAGRGPYAIRLAEIQKTDRVLNVGCFNGALERHYLNDRCQEAYGIDVNEEAVKFATQHAVRPQQFSVSQAETLPFPDQHFDKVFLLDVLEHVENERKTLQEIHRVLKPGGKLILSVPHDFLNFLDPDELTRGLRNFVRKNIRKKPLLNHPKHRHYNEQQLRDLLDGFQIEKIHRSGTPVFWSLAMFYNAVALPEELTAPLRKLTNPIENFEYALALPTGFNIMIRASKNTH